MEEGSQKVRNVPYRTHNKILAILSNNMPLEMSLDKRFIKFSNNVLNHSTGIIKSIASLSLYNPWSTFNRNNNYVCQMYSSSINESSVFKVWYDSISDVERAEVSVLDDVISVCDGYKQCDLSKDEMSKDEITIEIICTN